MKKIFFLLIYLGISVIYLNAQETKKINIINADIAIDESSTRRTRMLDNVIFQHDSAFLYCDSAYFYNAQNSLEAFGKVHLIMNDTIHLFCRRLIYNGNTRIANARNEVVLKDNTMTLYTDSLDYFRNDNYAYYPKKGKIIDEEKQLFSDIGFYFSDFNEFHFQKNVLLMDSAYHLLSDTLLYNTETNIATILGPTEIIGEERYSYCEKGWYNTETDDAHLYINVCATESTKISYCDSAYYDHLTQIAYSFGNISATDTVEQITIKGNYAEYHRSERFGFVIDSAVAVFVDEKDSLFLHADTFFIQIDTSEKIQYISTFHHTKFFRTDLQGACDSLIYVASDSTIRMYSKPILWSEKNQMTSDSIYMFISKQTIDSMIFYHNAFVIAIDTLKNYNQVKGKTVIALFKDNEIQRITSIGNAESVYYIRDDEKSLIGIDKASSSLLYILLKDNEFESVTYIKDAKATTFPKKEFPEEYKKLRGFQWQEARRPLEKKDIFLKD
ncbi:MAG: OstA-like protein [Bacteroidales bacterium]|nr:OstA-like protein [Bacteroidales bacterium]